MIIKGENDVVIGNAGETKAFTIAASAKAFKVLSSNIYKNKIRAVVRELVCNAVDAHVLNGNKRPYTIQGPNILDPRFVVRDYGPGLSDEDMIELYTTYFASTKADRNDQIGALGLGSKSPFSYTSTFSVVSYFEGMVSVYSCILSGGEPAIVKTHEEPFDDDDRSGIEVIVPVKVDDISKWHNEIGYVMRPFPSESYEITGILDFTVESFDKLETFNINWFGVRRSNHASGTYAVYGNIVYPLGGVEGMDSSWLTQKYSTVYIHFELGELDIQPSREELSLDEETVANIVKRVNTLNDDVRESDLDKIRALNNPRAVSRALTALPGGAIAVLTNANLKFLGKTVPELTAGHDFTQLHSRINSAGRLYTYSYGKAIPKRAIISSPGSWRRRKAAEVNLANVYSFNQTRAFILLNDSKKNVRTTLLGLYESSDPNHPTIDEYVYVTSEDDPRSPDILREIRCAMAMDEVITLRSSELEDIRKLVHGYGVKRTRETAPRPASPNGIKYVFDDENKYFVGTDLYMTSNEVHELEGYVIGQYRDNPAVLHDNFNIAVGIEIDKIKSMARTMGVKEFTMVRPSIWEKVKRNENVDCLFKDAFQQLKDLTKLVKPPEVYYLNARSRLCQNIVAHKSLKFLISELTCTKNPNAQAYNLWASRFNSIRFTEKTTFSKLVDVYVNKWSKSTEVAKESFKFNHANFKKANQFIEYYLNDVYSLSSESAQQLADQYKILNPSK